ncbi:MAG: hypothetical protein AB9869_35120 [Verrucomicrobiia bacterium]
MKRYFYFLAAVCLLSLGLTEIAQGLPFRFSGTVTSSSVDGVTVGDAFTAILSYDHNQSGFQFGDAMAYGIDAFSVNVGEHTWIGSTFVVVTPSTFGNCDVAGPPFNDPRFELRVTSVPPYPLPTTLDPDTIGTVRVLNDYRYVLTGDITNIDDLDPLIPKIVCPPDERLEADGNCQAVLPDLRDKLDVSDDKDSREQLFIEQAPPPGTLLDLGETSVRFSVTDTDGNSVSCGISAFVEDLTPPVIEGLSSTTIGSWVLATVDYSVRENCSPVTISLSVRCPEGPCPADYVLIPGDVNHIFLRAETRGAGNKRTYIVTVSGTDNAGNAVMQDVPIVVRCVQTRATGK